MHLRATPHLDDTETGFNPDYTYRRYEALQRLVHGEETQTDNWAVLAKMVNTSDSFYSTSSELTITFFN